MFFSSAQAGVEQAAGHCRPGAVAGGARAGGELTTNTS